MIFFVMDVIPPKVPESIGVPGPGYVWGNPHYTFNLKSWACHVFFVLDRIPLKVPASIGVPGPGYVSGNPNYTFTIFEKPSVSFFLFWMGFPQKCLKSSLYHDIFCVMDGIPWKVPESIGVTGPGYVSGNPNYTLKKFEKLIVSYFLLWMGFPQKYLSP